MVRFNLDSDVDTLELTSERLRSNPGLLENLANDPQSVLHELGLTVDQETANALNMYAGVSKSNATVQAAVVHIDA